MEQNNKYRIDIAKVHLKAVLWLKNSSVSSKLEPCNIFKMFLNSSDTEP